MVFRLPPSSVRLAVMAVAFLGITACSDSPVQSSAPAPAFDAPSLALAQSGPERIVGGEVILKVRPGAELADVVRSHGLALGRVGYERTFGVAQGGAGLENANARALRSDPRVEYAEPNYIRTAETIDPRLWAFYNPGGLNMSFTKGSSKGSPIPPQHASLDDADVDNVEGYASGGTPVVIGSIDTGVDMFHPEFTGRLIAGRDWVRNDDDPSDDNGHGTHTTGTMAGINVGIAGVSGAASNVSVYVQRVCGPRGCFTDAIVNAIRAAADYPGMVAMNLSLGGPSLAQSERDAIAYATSKGVLVIASAGNSGTGTISCPACDPDAISVASSTWRDVRASYSQFGPGLDIIAPGGLCFSNTTPEGCIYSAYKDGGYAWLLGTSMAAPQVTGTAAIVASVTGLRGEALRERLLSTTDDLGAAGYDEEFGNGRLNSYRAVTGKTLRER